MKILVTGGAGFIGSHFIKYLLKAHPDYDIWCVDVLTYAGNINNLTGIMKNDHFHFVRTNITDRQSIFGLFNREQFDVVVNFAAESHVDNSILTPEVFIDTNIVGTMVLLDACKKYSVSRFHQVSTDEVYGELPLDRPELLFTEDTSIKASSPYSASKASADLLVGAYHRTYGMPTTISRCSNNYGPYQFPEKLIPLMCINLITNKKLPVYGDGLNVRDWLYVEDHCKAIDMILMKGTSGEVYNIGGNNEKSNISIVKEILRLTGKSEDCINYVADRAGHDRRYAIDATKMYNELGWQPIMSFQEGMLLTVKWYTEHTDWWKDIISNKYKEDNSNI